MFETSIEKPSNLLTIRFAGSVDAEEARLCAAQVQSVLEELQPGFRLLSDLSALVKMDLACVPFIEQVMDRCNDKGISMVVRVIPDPHKDIGFNILSLFHYRRGVRIVACQKMDEAQQALARKS